MDYTRRWVLALLASVPFVTCTGEDAPSLRDPNGGGGKQSSNTGGGAAGDDQLDASADQASGLDASIDGPDAGTGDTTTCAQLTCRGAGRCVEVEGEPTCVCDEGYVLSSTNECIVDESCIELRLLEPAGCRQRLQLEPAMSMLFSVETCAGTNVRPDVLGPISQAFEVLEDDEELNDENFATIVDRDVESLVAIALDMSASVTQNPALVQELLDSIGDLVESLRPAVDAPPVHVSLIVFGRSVETVVRFDEGIDAVITKLAEIRANPSEAVSDPEGTNLNGAVNTGMDSLQDAWAQRIDATSGAVVLTGTLVTVADGRDTGGVSLEPLEAHFNALSVGVSNDIDDAELTRVGPQGSFLAPLASDRRAAFAAVTQRVAEYPGRAHLLAYCSPAVAGTHTLRATLANQEAAATAVCDFNAAQFGVGAGACNEAFFSNYCAADNHPCGGFFACGLCAPDAGATDDRAQWQFTEAL